MNNNETDQLGPLGIVRQVGYTAYANCVHITNGERPFYQALEGSTEHLGDVVMYCCKECFENIGVSVTIEIQK